MRGRKGGWGGLRGMGGRLVRREGMREGEREGEKWEVKEFIRNSLL